MDQSAVTGEHVVLEGDTVQTKALEMHEPTVPMLTLEEDAPETDPSNTSTVKVLRPSRNFR